MRGLKGFMPLVLIGLAGLAWLLFVSEPGSHWLTSFLAPSSAPGAVVARLVRADGGVKRVHGGDVQKLKTPLASPLDLHDGDRIEVDKKSNAVLVLNSNDEIELQPLTAVTLQLWNEQDPKSPVYLNVLTGEVELLKAGVRGRAYVVREGRLYLPGQKALKKPMALTVLRSAPLDMSLSEATALESEAENATGRAGDDGKAAAGLTPEPETLSNEYIDETLVARQGQFQKCWLSRLKDKPELKGQIVLQFEISRRGKVRDLKVADSSLTDDTLTKCVTSVVERISFRSFKGPEISLSYPITFE